MHRPFFAALCVISLLAFGCNGEQAAQDEGAKRKIVTTDLEPGAGDPVGEGNLVMLEYTGKVVGAAEPFDSNTAIGADGTPVKPPLSTVIGSHVMVRGFEEALIGMKKGMVRKVVVPWELGYGAEGNPEAKIPPESDLEFTIKLLDFVNPDEATTYSADDVSAGSGRAAKKTDRVTIHYRGTYVNGKLFDSSYLRGDVAKGGEPYTFVIGRSEAIPGVDDGVIGMRVGGVRRLVIPPGLAFGSEGYSTIMGNQVLIIEIKMLDIEPTS